MPAGYERLLERVDPLLAKLYRRHNMRYRKKPVVVDAVEWNGKNTTELAKFMGALVELTPDGNGLKIKTLEGTMTAAPGDWIIKGVQGEFYPCKPDIFEETYERATCGSNDARACRERAPEGSRVHRGHGHP
jgi:hypothetical protein